MPSAITACDLQPRRGFDFIFTRWIRIETVSEKFKKYEFGAVSRVEMIEHLENPRHALRQIKSLLKDEGILFIPTLNASKFYSRLGFFLREKWSCLQMALM